MAEDAVNVAKAAGVIFESELDKFGNGLVTALFIIHAGLGGEVTGNPNDIWSHKWSLWYPT